MASKKIELARLFATLEMDNSKLKKDVQEVPSLFNGMTKKVTGILSSAAIGKVLYDSMSAALDTFSGIEEGMNKIGTMGTFAEENLNSLKNSFFDIAAEIPVEITDLTEAGYQALSAGVGKHAETVTEKFNLVSVAVEAAAKGAVGGFTTVETALNGLTSIMNIYSDSMIDANKTMDIFIATQNEGKTTVGELAESIGRVAPIAKNMGLSFEDLSAALAVITSQGIATSEAVTGLKAFLSNLAKPSVEAIKVSRMLGIEFSSVAMKAKGLGGFLSEIVEKIGGTATAMNEISDDSVETMKRKFDELGISTTSLIKTNAAGEMSFTRMGKKMSAMVLNGTDTVSMLTSLFGSMEAVNTVLALNADDGERYVTALENIKNAAGVADEASRKMAKGFNNQFMLLKNKFLPILDAVGGAIAEQLLPYMSTLGDYFKDNSEYISIMFVDALKGVGDIINTILLPAFKNMGIVLDTVNVIFTTVSGMWTFFRYAVDPFGSYWHDVRENLAETQKEIDALSKSMDNITKHDFKNIEDLLSYLDTLEENEAIFNLKNDLKDSYAELDELKELYKKFVQDGKEQEAVEVKVMVEAAQFKIEELLKKGDELREQITKENNIIIENEKAKAKLKEVQNELVNTFSTNLNTLNLDDYINVGLNLDQFNNDVNQMGKDLDEEIVKLKKKLLLKFNVDDQQALEKLENFRNQVDSIQINIKADQILQDNLDNILEKMKGFRGEIGALFDGSKQEFIILPEESEIQTSAEIFEFSFSDKINLIQMELVDALTTSFQRSLGEELENFLKTGDFDFKSIFESMSNTAINVVTQGASKLITDNIMPSLSSIFTNPTTGLIAGAGLLVGQIFNIWNDKGKELIDGIDYNVMDYGQNQWRQDLAVMTTEYKNAFIDAFDDIWSSWEKEGQESFRNLFSEDFSKESVKDFTDYLGDVLRDIGGVFSEGLNFILEGDLFDTITRDATTAYQKLQDITGMTTEEISKAFNEKNELFKQHVQGLISDDEFSELIQQWKQTYKGFDEAVKESGLDAYMETVTNNMRQALPESEKLWENTLARMSAYREQIEAQGINYDDFTSQLRVYFDQVYKEMELGLEDVYLMLGSTAPENWESMLLGFSESFDFSMENLISSFGDFDEFTKFIMNQTVETVDNIETKMRNFGMTGKDIKIFESWASGMNADELIEQFGESAKKSLDSTLLILKDMVDSGILTEKQLLENFGIEYEIMFAKLEEDWSRLPEVVSESGEETAKEVEKVTISAFEKAEKAVRESFKQKDRQLLNSWLKGDDWETIFNKFGDDAFDQLNGQLNKINSLLEEGYSAKDISKILGLDFSNEEEFLKYFGELEKSYNSYLKEVEKTENIINSTYESIESHLSKELESREKIIESLYKQRDTMLEIMGTNNEETEKQIDNYLDNIDKMVAAYEKAQNETEEINKDIIAQYASNNEKIIKDLNNLTKDLDEEQTENLKNKLSELEELKKSMIDEGLTEFDINRDIQERLGLLAEEFGLNVSLLNIQLEKNTAAKELNELVKSYNEEELENLSAVNEANLNILEYRLQVAGLDTSRLETIRNISNEEDRQREIFIFMNELKKSGLDIDLQDYQINLMKNDITIEELNSKKEVRETAREMLKDMEEELLIKRKRYEEADLPSYEIEKLISKEKQQHLKNVSEILGLDMTELEVLDEQLIITQEQKKETLEMAEEKLAQMNDTIEKMREEGATSKEINDFRISQLKEVSGVLGLQTDELDKIATKQEKAKESEEFQKKYREESLEAFKGMQTSMESVSELLKTSLLPIIQQMSEVDLENPGNTMEKGFNNALNKANELQELMKSEGFNFAESIGETGIGKNTGLSLAKGMEYVPFDNFPANLHIGEAVLTKEENELWSSLKHSILEGNRTVNNSSSEKSIYLNFSGAVFGGNLTKEEVSEWMKEVLMSSVEV